MKERANSPKSSSLRKKYVRLKSTTLIQTLFDRKSANVVRVSAGVVSLIYREESQDALSSIHPLHVGFAVNRSIRKAVDRNRIKRLMRESMRKHIDALDPLIPKGSCLVIMSMYRSSHLGLEVDRDMQMAVSKMKSKLTVN